MIRVLIADDHPLLRQGIRHLLESQPDMEVIGEVGDGEEAVRQSVDQKPDVVLMDIEMPVVDGLQATRRIRSECPATRVLVLTIHVEDEYVQGLLKAGADGYLLKSTYGPSLVEGVRLASMGEMVLDSRVGKVLLDHEQAATPAPAGPPAQAAVAEEPPKGLSAREIQLLRWIARGMTNADIARASGVSERTVKGYVARVFDKLEVGTRSAAVAAAIRLGVLRSAEL